MPLRIAGATAVVVSLTVLLSLRSASARDEAAPQTATSFEVASVKAQPQESQTGVIAAIVASQPFMRLDGSRFRAGNMTAARLILEAYGREYVHRDQIQEGPGWLDQERFQIEALTPMEFSRNGSAMPEPVLGMLANLLETRFKLRVSREMRERPVYALVRARTDGRLREGMKASRDDCTTTVDARPGEPGFRKECIGQTRIDGIKLVARPMEELTRFLRGRLGRLVVDETGLTGNFDIELSYEVPPQIPANASPAAIAEFSSGIFTAVQEDLGLKLENTVRRIPVLVIEHIERPSPN